MSTPVQPLVEAVAAAIQPELFGLFAAVDDHITHDIGPEARIIAIKAIHTIASRTSADRQAAVATLSGDAYFRGVIFAEPTATDDAKDGATKRVRDSELALLALLGVPPVPDTEIERLVDALIDAALCDDGQDIGPLKDVQNARTALLTAIQQRRPISPVELRGAAAMQRLIVAARKTGIDYGPAIESQTWSGDEHDAVNNLIYVVFELFGHEATVGGAS